MNNQFNPNNNPALDFIKPQEKKIETIQPEKSNKAIKNLKNDFLFYIILQLIILGYYIFNSIIQNIEKSYIEPNYIKTIVFGSINVIIFIMGYIVARKKLKIAGVVGLVCSLYLITGAIVLGSIIDLLLAIFLFFHSIKYLKHSKEIIL